jgi:hypothetical protein
VTAVKTRPSSDARPDTQTSRYRTELGYTKRDLDYLDSLHRTQGLTKQPANEPDFPLALEWGEAWSKAREGTFSRYRLVKDGGVIGLFQGLVRRNYFYSYMTAGATSGYGLAIVTDDLERDSAIFLKDILMKQNALSNFSIFAKCPIKLPGLTIKQKYTFYIDLTKPLEQITDSMDKSTRWAIRKARNNQVRVEISAGRDALRDAYEMVSAVSRRRDFLIPRFTWIATVRGEFGESADCVAVLASFNGELVSAAYFLGYKGKINWLFSGSTPTGYKMQAGSLVQMKIIEWAKSSGYKVYDMGGTDLYDPQKAGIHAFKSGFGGSLASNFLVEKKTWLHPTALKLYAIYRKFDGYKNRLKRTQTQ